MNLVARVYEPFRRSPGLFLAAFVLAFAALSVRAEPASESSFVRLEVDGISASIGEDDPRVLYILPWQAPSLPRRPRANLDDKVPQLVQPIAPRALERHRLFRQTLNPLVLSPEMDSALTVQ